MCLFQELNNEHTGAVWCVRFSVCGRLMSTAGQDNMIRVWVARSHLKYFLQMRERLSFPLISWTISPVSEGFFYNSSFPFIVVRSFFSSVADHACLNSSALISCSRYCVRLYLTTSIVSFCKFRINSPVSPVQCNRRSGGDEGPLEHLLSYQMSMRADQWILLIWEPRKSSYFSQSSQHNRQLFFFYCSRTAKLSRLWDRMPIASSLDKWSIMVATSSCCLISFQVANTFLSFKTLRAMKMEMKMWDGSTLIFVFFTVPSLLWVISTRL